MLVLCLLLLSQTLQAKDASVIILSSGKSPTYLEIIETIKDTVITRHKNTRFQTIFTDDAESAIIIKNADLLLTIGRRAMLAASHYETTPPILSSLVPRQAFRQNLKALKSANKHVAAIYIDSPPERQILLAKLLLGTQQTIGIMLSSSSAPEQNHIIRLLEKAGLKYRIEDINTEKNLIRKLSRLLADSDTLLALPDPVIFNRNTARNILLTTYRQRIPVIGFSANYVKAGALAAAFSTAEQIAQQTADTVVKILQGSEDFIFKGRYPSRFDITINTNVARSLGISTLPASSLKKQLETALEKFK